MKKLIEEIGFIEYDHVENLYINGKNEYIVFDEKKQLLKYYDSNNLLLLEGSFEEIKNYVVNNIV